MGGKRVTNRNLWVYKIDPDRNLLYVKGSVPGKPGVFVRVTDARDQVFEAAAPPPFPTFEGDVPEQLIAPAGKTDPLNFRT
jgi:large subunit ribosomal protein L3